MMTCWQSYHTPTTVDEALDLLSRYNGKGRMVGGGTDLILEMQQGHRDPVEALVDPTHIAELASITEEDDYLVIGAGVTHSQIVADERIRQHGTCLVESSGVIGGPQVRNVGTLAGNVAHALPAGDGTIGLLALDGDVEVASQDAGRVWQPMGETFVGPGKSTVDPTHMLITRLRFKPTGEDMGSAFRRVMRPQGVALPILSMAARVQVEGSTVTGVRITMGPAGKTPFLAKRAGEQLEGHEASPERLAATAEAVREEASFRNSRHRATSDYRQEIMAPELVKTLALAIHRAQTGEVEPEGVGE